MKRTIKNLAKAFIGESQARNRYGIYAKVAKKEGFEQISSIFEETADQEREHAKQLFKMLGKLKGKSEIDLAEIVVEAEMPTDFGSTAENLQAAINGETYEKNTMYPDFAKIADEEGLSEIAARLRSIAVAEDHHRDRYQKILDVLNEKKTFKKDEKKVWTCRKCGYVHESNEAPKECPACSHPQAYYQLKCEKY